MPCLTHHRRGVSLRNGGKEERKGKKKNLEHWANDGAKLGGASSHSHWGGKETNEGICSLNGRTPGFRFTRLRTEGG